MQTLLSNIEIKLNENIYIKDPNSSDLGRRIISGSIDLIDKLGFEQFTFKKLGEYIQSPEASVYRYFESKHKILLYITSWYWTWMEYQLVFSLANIMSPEERLKKAILLLSGELENTVTYSHINKVSLHKILITESSKSYLSKDVDDENSQGVFLGYKKVVGRVSDIVTEINPDYKFPHMLISTMVEGSHHQRFFADHLPRLTDQLEGSDAIQDFYVDLIFKAIQ
jgi:AcrR family transcriptional regulator